MWLQAWDFEKHEETKTNPSDVWGGKIWFWGGNWDERLTKRKGYVKNYGEVNKKWEWFEENHTNWNPRGRGKACLPHQKVETFLAFDQKGVAWHWERVEWGWRKGKEELYFSFRLGAQHRRKMVEASKSPKGMGLWFVLPREWQWHTHTQKQSQGQVSRFYSMSPWFGLSTDKALLPRKHTPIKPTKHNFTCLLSVRAVKWKQVRKQYNIVLKTPQ